MAGETVHSNWAAFDFTVAEYEDYHDGVEDIMGRTGIPECLYINEQRKNPAIVFRTKKDYGVKKQAWLIPIIGFTL
ncbi:MAG: hypothetical protein IPL53_19460 [Ignavibacteria bacterium]|nr:hypothetical protein [Ignavibacteria bacterium]